MAPSGPPAKAAAKADAGAAAKAKADAKAKAKKKEKEVKEAEDAKPKVPEPDKDKYQEKTDKINEQIEKLQVKLKALSAQIGERSAGKEDFFAKKAQLRSQLDEYSTKINALQEEKDAIFKQLGDKKEEGKSMRQELNKLKKSMSYTSEEQITQRIREIEYGMVTNVMTLKEEKDMLKEISELKRNRPKLAQVASMEDKVSNFDTGAGLSIKERTEAIKQKLNEERDAKKVVSEQLKALVDERNASTGDMADLFDQREALNKQIREKIQERNELRDEFRQQERDFKAYLAEIRAARQEAWRAEKAERDAEYEKERRIRAADKLEEQPHLAETTLIEQTIFWCNSQMPKEKDSGEVEKKEITHNIKDGETVLKKKGEEEEYYFAPTKKAKASKAKGKKETKAIKHNAETFRLFSQLKLDAPVNTDDIPPLLEKLEAQKAMYVEKIEAWRVNREEMKAKILAGESPDAEEKAEEEEKAE